MPTSNSACDKAPSLPSTCAEEELDSSTPPPRARLATSTAATRHAVSVTNSASPSASLHDVIGGNRSDKDTDAASSPASGESIGSMAHLTVTGGENVDATSSPGASRTGPGPGPDRAPLSKHPVPSLSQQQLTEYREKLACDLERRELSARAMASGSYDMARVSPIPEDKGALAPFDSPLVTSLLTTTSTDSGNTIRDSMTPGFIAGTPSYPFPRMATAGCEPPSPDQPNPLPRLTSIGTYQMPPYESISVQDKILSPESTAASSLTFNPAGVPHHQDNFDFPSPNLYELSLMLAAEPGLDAWWTTVVQIMTQVYKAERVTLAVPADSTDIENVPWGQKATYSQFQEDDFSLGYMARESNSNETHERASSGPAVADEKDMFKPGTPTRPGLESRHSFTSFEENKGKTWDQSPSIPGRPVNLVRSKSYLPHLKSQRDLTPHYQELNKDALDEHDAAEGQQRIPGWEAPLQRGQSSQGRVFPVLQALNYEADSLINHEGVMKVLERGKAIALTRSYSYLKTCSGSDPTANATPTSKPAPTPSPRKSKKQRAESNSKLSSIFSSSASTRRAAAGHTDAGENGRHFVSRYDEDEPRPPTPKYEEYEQSSQSPWSQSPAPSPAVRPDTKENPFFTDAMVDEDSFNPTSSPTDYVGMRPPQAIGLDNSWTVLHIPLSHVLLSKPSHPFKLDLTAMMQKSESRSKDAVPRAPREVGSQADIVERSSRRDKPSPMAILSILTPVIPYPSNLRRSLEHLAPHMATSFSLCRHYSNLETEIAGFQRRRPATAGFGAVDAAGRPIASRAYLTSEDLARGPSILDSTTSPSDYSAVSRSGTGSPSGTPGWEQGSLGSILDRRQPPPSPAGVSSGGESYFSHRQKASKQELFSSRPQRSKSSSKDNSPIDRRPSRLSGGRYIPEVSDVDELAEGKVSRASDEGAAATGANTRALKDFDSGDTEALDDERPEKPSEKLVEVARTEQLYAQHRHSVLHSYGADFASTFQSLPPSSSLTSKPPPTGLVPSRTNSYTTVVDMPPPSDRLKGLILDSLPAHVFVALPQTGEIVWVNSRYLSYRGQAVSDLAADPWGSIHPEDRDEYLKAWGHSLRTDEQFSRTVRIRRFDGAYRWFHARAVASRDKRGVIVQFLGSYMDIHDQHIAELKAARQEEIEASEAKHRLLANLIPQIIFTATEDDAITFANEQWLSYSGQCFDDALGLGFMDYVHPDDLAKCRIPTDQHPTPVTRKRDQEGKAQTEPSTETFTSSSDLQASHGAAPALESNLRGVHQALSRNNSSSSSSVYELPTADLAELAKKGIIKVGTDSNGRPSYTTEVRLRTKTGEYRWHLVRCVEIDTIDFGSGASSYFGSATDINDHKLLEAKLKEAMESKGRFLSNMSHEIRTPLIGISGMVTFLQDTILNEEQRDYTNTIQTSANSLIMIINDILDLSKVDAGMMKLKYEWFHTPSLIEDVNELVSTMAIAKRLELNYLVEADVPAWVKGDKVRIRQVLLNVIGNAIKFTSTGEVFSRCRVCKGHPSLTDANQIILEFAITDTGRGFSKKEADLIFKPFSQIDGSSTRQHGGSGLGLVISRQLVELHGGSMEGTAVPGRGATFTFTAKFSLPTAEDHPSLSGSSISRVPTALRFESSETVVKETNPLPPAKQFRHLEESSPHATEAESASPAVTSTGSSNPSSISGRSHATHRTSVGSVNAGLARFSEAAKASGQDLSQMKLEMPSGRDSPGRTGTPSHLDQRAAGDARPPMYSILIICPQLHSREATAQHIEMTLPKDVPHQITALATAEEAAKLMGREESIKFTHIVINLGFAEAIVSLLDKITKSQKLNSTTILILSDSVQRQEVMMLAKDTEYEKLFTGSLVTFIYKPVKPSRFAVIFDPDKMRDMSIDRNRSSAQQMVESQKVSYQEIEKLMGNKGYKVLLVEDNSVNQKVLTKYLKKIGVDVEVAVDGVECTDMVLSKPHPYYSLILVGRYSCGGRQRCC